MDPICCALIQGLLLCGGVHDFSDDLSQVVFLEDGHELFAANLDLVEGSGEGGSVVEGDHDGVVLGGEELDQGSQLVGVHSPVHVAVNRHHVGEWLVFLLDSGDFGFGVVVIAVMREAAHVHEDCGLHHRVVGSCRGEVNCFLQFIEMFLSFVILADFESPGSDLGFFLVEDEVLASEIVPAHPGGHDVAFGATHRQHVTPVHIILLNEFGVRVVIDLDAPQRGIPEPRIVPDHCILDLLDVQHVSSLLEGIADVVDVQVQELSYAVGVVEKVVQLIANVPITSIVQIIRAVLEFFLNLDARQSLFRDQVLVQVPFQDLIEIVHDVL